MTNAYICDRCGKILSEFEMAHTVTADDFLINHEFRKRYHLCAGCFDNFCGEYLENLASCRSECHAELGERVCTDHGWEFYYNTECGTVYMTDGEHPYEYCPGCGMKSVDSTPPEKGRRR